MSNRQTSTSILHAISDNGDHAVGVSALSVLVEPDGDAWIAQGIEIDYAASGTTLEDAKRRFEAGLKATIREHLRRYSNVERLLRWAPNSVVQHFAECKHRYAFSQVSLHQENDLVKLVPYEAITFAYLRAA
jgi:hypothetical protein